MLKRIIAAGVSLGILIGGEHLTPLGEWQYHRVLFFFLYMIPYLTVGYDILRKAGKGIKHHQVFDENFLMAAATLGAIAIALLGQGDYTEAVAVMLFYQIGELFQSYAVGKSRKNISELMDIRPDYANWENGSEVVQTDPDEVTVGSVIVVKPGEKIPIDGVVIEGSSSLNTSALTGESVPREANIGDEVISGCISLTGVLRIRTTKEFGESTVSRILDLVENASSKKSRSENFISRFAKYYTPIVCYSALALAILPPLFLILFMGTASTGSLWMDWIYRALTFLVISCPCALVISIPLSFFAGIGGAGREGILVKGSIYLEALAGTDCVVFDKTGTMTEGVFEVSGVYHDTLTEKEELLQWAACAEYYSPHPISKSLAKAYGKPISPETVDRVQEISGQGISAYVEGKRVLVGNEKLMAENGISCAKPTQIGTVVHVAVEKRYMGYIVISDRIKATAEGALKDLRKVGVRKTVMLTGDRKQVAQQVGKQLGIDQIFAELLPEEKVLKVEEMLAGKAPKSTLAFVGDGVNDAPVLSRADVGIAMGAMGSDAAIEAADIVLMDDDPGKIAKAIRIAKKCMRIVYENIWFAIGIKVLCLLLGAVGIANMWLAIFADVGVMVLAVLNAIRVLFVKKE